MNLKTFNEIMSISASTLGKHANQPFNIPDVKRIGKDGKSNGPVKSLKYTINKSK